MNKYCITVIAAALATQSVLAMAQEPSSCQVIRTANVGWLDGISTNALTQVVAQGLGYEFDDKMLSLPIVLKSLSEGKLDTFINYWSPSQDPLINPLRDSLAVLQAPNLTGAKYTLAVPKFLADEGLRDFKDIEKFKDQLGGRIYGIQPGSGGNTLVQKIITDNSYGLKDFKLIESGEAGMIQEVTRSIQRKKPIVFLAWAPHPMNINLDIFYLTGGDDSFGPDFGAATVKTITSKDYAERCGNIGKLYSNLRFTVEMESSMMNSLDKKEPALSAAKKWLANHPETLDSWLDGVTTIDGKDGKTAVLASLSK
ncbi:choline ABC transporter substrate-binding protein [Pseudomonas sp. 51_B]|uniref:choline ABC transporter substrate-binding protein n=1 Tax=Pseudomonas sp. 51_B TaxID=2813573 RepID=UPI001A9D3EEC|nr:choline ABC transporter substrate-binding protein [Pseudomonas sp. 51_B]